MEYLKFATVRPDDYRGVVVHYNLVPTVGECISKLATLELDDVAWANPVGRYSAPHVPSIHSEVTLSRIRNIQMLGY